MKVNFHDLEINCNKHISNQPHGVNQSGFPLFLIFNSDMSFFCVKVAGLAILCFF